MLAPPATLLVVSGSRRRPDAPPPWIELEREHLQDCAVFRVARSWARSPRSGRPHPFYRIDSPDWVNVVPVTPEGRIVMVRQYRHGSCTHTLEIPGGMVDPGETPAEAAARELLEETGYRPERVEPIGALNPNPALFGNTCHTFVARGAVPVGQVRNEGNEETVVECVERDALFELARGGEIDHALVVAALYWFEEGERRAAEGSG